MNESRTDVRPGGTASWSAVWAARQPDRPCLTFRDETFTWRAFNDAIDNLAAHLYGLGVRKGDRVACLLPNRPEYLMTLWATLRLGAIFFPYNVRLTPVELVPILDDSDPALVVTDATFGEVQEELRARRPTRWLDVDAVAASLRQPTDRRDFEVPWLAGDDPAAVLYTSGTTGKSKGAVLTHGNFLHQSLAWTSGFGLTGQDRYLNMLPLCYTGGLLNPTLPAFQSGASVVLLPRFDAEDALRQIERHRITWTTATPQLVEAILTHPAADSFDISSLTRLQTGGAPVPIELAEIAAKRNVAVIQGYGITEATGGVNFFLPPEDAVRKAGSIGKVAPYDEVRVVDDHRQDVKPGDVGELLLRGPLVMQGYWNNEAATKETVVDGWLHTGDLARRDEEGYVTLAGRKKEMIITGGLNVYPIEVEQVLRTFPEIEDVAVVGLMDDTWGERVAAFVVLAPGARLTGDELIARSRASLAGYRVPKTVVFLDEFPRTASGKIRKPVLREQWQAHR
jgi:fatty-acyl-CoA synthase